MSLCRRASISGITSFALHPHNGPLPVGGRVDRPAAQSAPSLKLWSASDLRAAGCCRRFHQPDQDGTGAASASPPAAKLFSTGTEEPRTPRRGSPYLATRGSETQPMCIISPDLRVGKAAKIAGT